MTLIIKAIVILLLFLILFALGSALYFLVHDQNNSDRIVKALSWRIGLSLILFIILIIAFAMGWISPHPI
jgi:putative copper export protein